MSINLHHGDCMDALKLMPDNAYDLAIVDPPYGIGIASNSFRQKHENKPWDKKSPEPAYFKELMRVSEQQIIWGGNYFDLPPSQGYIIWDKKQPVNFSSAMCEFAYTSIKKPAKMFRKHVVTAEKNKIHPTQKPVALYKWLLSNYAEKGDKILDTYLGSGSIAIACHDMGFDLDAWELDKDYYEAASKRLKTHQSQGSLFDPKEMRA